MENQSLENLLKNELFIKGLFLGICISKQILLSAFSRREPLVINGELYYILGGGELLLQMMDEICG